METFTPHTLTNRNALISGGHSGIGLAVAAKLQAAGAQAAVADISSPNHLPVGITSFSCDITNAAQIDNLYGEVNAHFGHPDILISNAGQGIHEKLTEGDPAKWQKVIELNLLGALRLIRAFVPGMLAAGSGDVVFISSVSAGQAYPYGGIYAATKSALQTVAETLRLEVLPTLRVITIAPGVTDTAFFKNTISGFHTADDIGYGALAPETVADAVLYALMQPPEVSVNHITVRPTLQPF
ncbi:SDR family oxidoreductase [Adhaeribacter aquaticus]|uniref:SDR family oxidoreductase n=1 Tax=Adhaeribacter aquaticus TaxID=299567 RepID=UPI0003F7529C|nr:SDR family NAD(P)-dependent oxidoreductase [Adhaeribacter aquaticus]